MDKEQGANEEINEDRIFDNTPWPAVSCSSFFWPFTERLELYEVRRAIANLTHGLRYSLRDQVSVIADDGTVTAADMLVFVRAASEVSKAANTTLHEVVAESVARGATWKQIGDTLGIQRTAAQKRFGKGVPKRRRDELNLEAVMCMMVSAYWNEQLTEEHLGFDESDWEDLPPESIVDFALRIFNKAILLLDSFIELGAEGVDDTTGRSGHDRKTVPYIRYLAEGNASTNVAEIIKGHLSSRPNNSR
jgi:hypothetical protein